MFTMNANKKHWMRILDIRLLFYMQIKMQKSEKSIAAFLSCTFFISDVLKRVVIYLDCKRSFYQVISK